MSTADSVMRWLSSDHMSLRIEPSGPGMPLRFMAVTARYPFSCRARASIVNCAMRCRTSGSEPRPILRACSASSAAVIWARVASAMPSVPRSCSSVVIATAQPLPASPRICDFGTTTSLKKISLNSASPVIWTSGLTSTPGLSMSTSRYVRPSRGLASLRSRVMSMHHLATCASVVHTFCPLTT